jgi:hypothetical protein
VEPVSSESLDFDGLRDAAKSAFEAWGGTQTALAERLGKSVSAVNQALSRSGAKYAALQRAIVEELTDYRVDEPSTRFVLVPKRPGHSR